MKQLFLMMAIIFAGSVLFAQDQVTEDTTNQFDMTQFGADNIYPDVPKVEFTIDNLNLMRAFYPLYYENEQEIRRDIRFVNRNDSVFNAVWDSLGYAILTTMTSLSGIEWVEQDLKIHLMKYLPCDRVYDPALFPLEGIKTSNYVEAAPNGLHQLMNLIMLLSGRNIQQVSDPKSIQHYLWDHPLLQQSAYRFDVIATNLAMATAIHIIQPDSLELIISSENWRRHNPGWITYENHFRYNWPLTSETPLVTYLANEPYNSALVNLTRPQSFVRPKSDKPVEAEPTILSAGGGRLGFSVIKTRLGLFEVVDVDTLGLGYSAGLQIGDLIKRVNGEVVRSTRDLMGKIIAKLDSDGVYLIVLREKIEVGILLLPVAVEETESKTAENSLKIDDIDKSAEAENKRLFDNQ
ncbi:MAG: hypothetical protein DRP51_07970 [Candidatus Zixiibacteriota bacterium]|nr:MAG: hypothetical protein DRP51_07970 [candidate division Zixibacteria bacterium]